MPIPSASADVRLADEQLALPLAIHDVPSKVRQHGLRETHSYPLVSQGKDDDGWSATRKPTWIAWRGWPEVELRSETAFPALILDCDTDLQACLNVAMGSDLPMPNWVVFRSQSGHAHVVYCLARPVLRGEHARPGPLRTFARIAEYYRYRYDADDGYVGVLTHNPVHPRYRRTSEWLREAPHKLVELAAPIPKHWRLPVKPTTAEGRNCLLFRYGMRWCGRPSNWEYIEGVGEVIAAANDALDVPLWESEVQGIAKSVIKISRRNLASGQTQQNFAFIQAARGRKSGEVRRRRTAERDAEIVRRVLAGESMRAVARAFGLWESAVRYVVRGCAMNQSR